MVVCCDGGGAGLMDQFAPKRRRPALHVTKWLSSHVSTSAGTHNSNYDDDDDGGGMCRN